LIEKTTATPADSKDFLSDLSEIVHSETSYNKDSSYKVVKSISDTIDVVADNFDNLSKAKKEGKSRAEWFRDQIDRTIETFNIVNPDELVAEVKDGLSTANNTISKEIFDSDFVVSEPLLNTEYKDLNKAAIIHDFQEDIKNNTLLGAIAFEKGGISIDQKHKEVKAVREYFDEKLDAPSDRYFKKAVSVATTIAQDRDMLPKRLKNKSPDEIAIMVDKGVTAAKVAYKVANNELSPLDAVEYTIDRNVAALNSAITRTCTNTGGAVVGKVGAAIGSIFGPVGTAVGAAVGTVVGKVGGYAVGRAVSKGIEIVADVAKSVCSSIWEGVKSVVSSAWEGVKSFFGWW
jgi:uncharacterized protein YcfJ